MIREQGKQRTTKSPLIPYMLHIVAWYLAISLWDEIMTCWTWLCVACCALVGRAMRDTLRAPTHRITASQATSMCTFQLH